MGLSIGDQAPEFEATASGGAAIRLADYRGKKNVVLYFYPGDFTPICTAEACGFRDMYDELQGKDTEVIGVSMDSDGSHKKFAAANHISFPLLADHDQSLSKKYGATNALFALFNKSRRVTFVIDKQGKIAQILKSELSSKKHLEGVQEALNKLS